MTQEEPRRQLASVSPPACFCCPSVSTIVSSVTTILLFCFVFVSSIPSASLAFSNNLPVHTLLLCRHGDSVWNGGQPGCEERFTGWTDVELSQQGCQEAMEAAAQLASYFYDIDCIFTSMLQRALDTTDACLTALGNNQKELPPVICDYRLAERHYGALQGLVKKDVEEGNSVFGYCPDLVEKWRRSWHTQPPTLDDNDERRIMEVDRLAEICGGAHNVPKGESLAMVAQNRVRPFLNEVVTPALNLAAKLKSQLSQKNVEEELTAGLVVAHANSLRALIGCLCEVEDDPVALGILESLRIPTGVPLVIHYQQLPNGRFRACPLPEPDECLIQDNWGYFNKPKEAPPNLGHPNLPVWPLDTCIPLEERTRADFFSAFANAAEDTYSRR
ncbi:3-bisphosphoglycerate-dependent phosphoglycerate mutase [Seminavis robusta]|uniref:phosphoglycerate mutase (2,3-diphosphoglycerate-dependent) n=1 Tax=Seminavis robusta TaxID=568900 RepID=A0A9N8DZA3_9STRA|nr:3-bisphosphoglycerate-dependent phosphoglycerate mutase [Seminavis robusta]|eukprot:Sro495_g154480.1 3-bisphosphoglycerate-dependent phosphoglycerate mutase (388) ;mRNA; f:33164-34469